MLLGKLVAGGVDFRVESTTHALKRMEEREVGHDAVISTLQELSCKIMAYNDTGEEIAVIAQEHDLAVIVEVRMNKVVIITVIDRADIYLKDGTMLEKIA